VTTPTGRDRVWALALDIAHNRYERGWLREFSPETVAAVATEHEIDVSTRTIRRVVDAMAALGILEDVGNAENREYRLSTWRSATHLSADDRSQEAATDVSADRSSEPATNVSQTNRETGDISVDTSVNEYQERDGDTFVTGPTSAFDGDRLIYHLFADVGVESESLSAYGSVVRVGLDPQDTEFSMAVKADATRPPLAETADLAVLHPPCQRWSTATRITGTQDEHPDLLDDAREVAGEIADDYVIENVPDAPLDDPVVLSGEMFGLPVPFKRAFETSFEVPEPPRQPTIEGYAEPFERDDGSLGLFLGEKDYWRTIKQVSGDYPAKPLKHSGIPAPYLHYLAYWWLRSRDESGGVGS